MFFFPIILLILLRLALQSCNRSAHLVALFVFSIGSFCTWDSFELQWLFNTLASGVNIMIRV